MDIQLATQIIQLERRVSVLETLEIPGNFTPSGILFANASGMIAQDSLLVWNDTSNRLGIGTSAPNTHVHIKFAGGSKIFLQIEDTAANGDTLLYLTASGIGSTSNFIYADTAAGDFMFRVRGDGVVIAASTIQSQGVLQSIQTDSGTDNLITGLQVQHLTSGTPGVGFGSAMTFQAHSSNNTIRNQSQIYSEWNVATDGSREGRIRLIAIDAVGPREGFRVTTNGSAPEIGFFGGAGTVKQTVTGTRTGTLGQLQTVVANLLTALAGYNLITDSTT